MTNRMKERAIPIETKCGVDKDKLTQFVWRTYDVSFIIIAEGYKLELNKLDVRK